MTMAVTKGHGNPNWSRDEVILALDLYFRCEGKIPSKKDPRVVELSKILNSLPLHVAARKNQAFRNPDGVAFKLQNLRQVATGKGLGNTSSVDEAVWADYGNSPQAVAELAKSIKDGIGQELPQPEEDEVFAEGRILTAQHLRRERSPKLRKKLLESLTKSDRLYCEGCGAPPKAKTEALRHAAYEVHHKRPLAMEEGKQQTRLADVALLCANCHRLIHRMMHVNRRWVGIDELKSEVS